MFNVNGLYTNVVDGVNKFLRPNPAGGRANGTQITDDWLNDVQSELLNVPAVAGLAAATGPGVLQLAPAIQALIAGSVAAEAAIRAMQTGNAKNAIYLTAATTLPNAQIGSFVELAGSASYITTLPAATGNPGAVFSFLCNCPVSQTLQSVSGGFFGLATPGTSVVLNPYQSLQVVSDGGSWIVLSPPFLQKPHYVGVQAGSIAIAQNTTYGIVSVPVTFPPFSKSGAFRVLATMCGNGSSSAAGGEQNFFSQLTDGTNIISGANWLVGSQAGSAWGTSEMRLSPATYPAGSTVTFTYKISTYGGPTTFAISGSYVELFVEEA